jgi:hypothetical protein
LRTAHPRTASYRRKEGGATVSLHPSLEILVSQLANRPDKNADEANLDNSNLDRPAIAHRRWRRVVHVWYPLVLPKSYFPDVTFC